MHGKFNGIECFHTAYKNSQMFVDYVWEMALNSQAWLIIVEQIIQYSVKFGSRNARCCVASVTATASLAHRLSNRRVYCTLQLFSQKAQVHLVFITFETHCNVHFFTYSERINMRIFTVKTYIRKNVWKVL